MFSHFIISGIQTAKSGQQVDDVFASSFTKKLYNRSRFLFYAFDGIVGFYKFKHSFFDGVQVILCTSTVQIQFTIITLGHRMLYSKRTLRIKLIHSCRNQKCKCAHVDSHTRSRINSDEFYSFWIVQFIIQTFGLIIYFGGDGCWCYSLILREMLIHIQKRNPHGHKNAFVAINTKKSNGF